MLLKRGTGQGTLRKLGKEGGEEIGGVISWHFRVAGERRKSMSVRVRKGDYVGDGLESKQSSKIQRATKGRRTSQGKRCGGVCLQIWHSQTNLLLQ